MKLTQHVPNFVDTDEVTSVTFTTLEEMLAGEWPARVKGYGEFHQFSITGGDTLMVEYDGGTKWWVVGFFSEGDPATLGLPEWKPKDKPKPNPTWKEIASQRPLHSKQDYS